jgi:hypothetical protein
MKYSYLLVILVAMLAASPCKAQQTATEDSTGATGVVLHADPRLSLLVYHATKPDNYNAAGRRTGSIYSVRGFRVQIYSGNDRNVATKRKIDFLHRFPGVRTYMTYVAPTFRVKVGDYKDRSSAQAMYQQVSKLYSPCMIVNDIIEINTFRND